MSSGLDRLLNAANASQELNREFILMNKDVEIAYFTVIGNGAFQEIIIRDTLEVISEWMKPLSNFILSRQAPKNRENIKELLARSGCDTIIGYLSITHALSLIDTFWVKPNGSILCWRDVSLYDKPFNEVIARTAFEGGLHGDQLSTTSPEYGTDGTFAKCWIREGNEIKLLKRGTSGFMNSGLESYSEFYVSQILEALGLSHVKYDLRSHDNIVCSACDIFTSEKEGYLPYAVVEKVRSTIPSVVRMYDNYGYKNFALDMFVCDSIIFNCDRHKGNFGFIVDNDAQKILRPAPLFDHNLSLLCYAIKEDFDEDEYLKQLGPRIGNEFTSDARECLTSEMRRKLINMKGFQFKKHPKYNLPDWRLEILEKLINNQIDLILKK